MQFIQNLSGIQEYRLRNGLTVLTVCDPSSTSVTINMTYTVGSRHETTGQTGMAHLLEHLVFSGTERFHDVMAEFNRRGMNANATTSWDRTCYFATFPHDEENITWYLDWLADTMQHVVIDHDTTQKEISVVLNEGQMRDHYISTMNTHLFEIAFPWHPYGKKVIGLPYDVKNLTVPQIQGFYDRYYQPNNATLIVTGQFDEAKVLDQITQFFGEIQGQPIDDHYHSFCEPQQEGERLVTLRRQGGQPIVGVLYPLPAASQPDYLLLEIATDCIADVPSGQLYDALIKTKKASMISGGCVALHDQSMGLFLATCEQACQLDELLEALSKQVENVHTTPITQEQLDRTKTAMLNQWDEVFNDTEQLASELAENIAHGDWRLFLLERERIAQASLEDVMAATQKYWVRSNRNAARYIPDENPTRAPKLVLSDLSHAFDALEKQPQNMGQQTAIPTPSELEEDTLRFTFDTQPGTLKMVLLPKENRAKRAYVQIDIRTGKDEDYFDKSLVSAATAALMTQGSSQYNRQAISDLIEQYSGDLHFAQSGNQLKIFLSAKKETILDLTRLALHLVKEANYPELELQEFKKAYAHSLKSQSTQPRQLSRKAVKRYLNQWEIGDIRYTPTTPEQLEYLDRLSRQDLLDFKQDFYGKGQVFVGIVGEFESEPLMDLIKTQVMQWSTAPEYAPILSPYHPMPSTVMTCNAPDQNNAHYYAVMPLAICSEDDDYIPLRLANTLIGGNQASRLWNTVRETAGLSYSINSSFKAARYEKSGRLAFSASFSADQKDRLCQLIHDTLDALKTQPITQEEFALAQQGMLEQSKLLFSKDSHICTALVSLLKNDRTLLRYVDIDERVKNTTLEQVHDVIRRYINTDHLVVAVSGDFE